VRFDQLHKVVGTLLPQLDPNWRGDANETLAFARQLEYVFTKTYEIKYPDNKARVLIPMNTEVPSGARSHTYTQTDEMGEAAIVHSYATDFPSVELNGTQVNQTIVSLGDSYNYSVQELREATMLGRQLDTMKAAIARRVMERKLDALACVGDTVTGLKGLANATGITAVSGAGVWASATADAIRGDVEKMWKQVFSDTKGTYVPDVLALDPDSYSVIVTKRLDDFNNMTVADYIIKTNPSIKTIEFWPRLATADGSGGSRILCYKKDPEVLEMFVPQDFEQMPPQAEGMAFKVACHMRWGGVVVRQPKAITYMDTV
jgi:hypothetical protein